MNITPDQSDRRCRRFTPTEIVAAWAGVGLCFLCLGASNWMTPTVPPFTGKWSLVHDYLYQVFGPRGIPAALFGVGALFVGAALAKWVKAQRVDSPTA